MAKINLLTIHYGENRGSFLQTYATCEILKSLGHEVTIIDLHDRKWRIVPRLKHAIGWRLLPNMLRFEYMRKKYLSPMTKTMYSIRKELIPDADYTITGSDQTWNPDITRDNCLAYFQKFVPDNCKRIALAASFGFKEWAFSDDLTVQVKRELDKFSAVSVRERSGIDICQKVFNVNAVQLCDPTIALGKFPEFDHSTKSYKEIFGVILSVSPLLKELAPILKKDLGLPFRTNAKSGISLHPQKEMNEFLYHSLWGYLDIHDFFSRINGSQFIVTDSFHGTVFCLLAKKDFIVIPCKNAILIEREIDLLSQFGLENRIIASLDEYQSRKSELLEPIDYTCVDAKFKLWRDKFISFLHDNIV